MKLTINIIISSLFFIGCNYNRTTNIVGIWTMVNAIDSPGLKITERTEFNKDGSYKCTLISKNDSVVSEFKGTYLYDKNKSSLTITTNGKCVENKIIEIKNNLIRIKSGQKNEIVLRRIM